MDGDTLLNLTLVLVFVLVGGVFAATEIALVSLRDSQLVQLERGSARGAHVAAVARDPNRFLAAVQIGVTVAGFFSAAYGGSTLAPDLAPYLEHLGLPEDAAADHRARGDDAAHRLPVAGARRAGAQAARAAALDRALAGRGAAARPVRHPDAPGDLAALGLDQRRGAAARR